MYTYSISGCILTILVALGIAKFQPNREWLAIPIGAGLILAGCIIDGVRNG